MFGTAKNYSDFVSPDALKTLEIKYDTSTTTCKLRLIIKKGEFVYINQ